MKSFFYFLNGAMSIILYFVNTVFWFIPIMLCSLVKLIPVKPLQRLVSSFADNCATLWISVNYINQQIFSRTKFSISLPESLSTSRWYLVIANHQSWVDILVLQRVFNRKIPFLKFFLKQNLLYVPFLGLVWWGLDFPFMKRYSKAYLKKHPHLQGKDLATTKAACAKFEDMPVSVMNFVEGTRFNQTKLNAPINKNLALTRTLAPKSGGVAFVLNAMGETLTDLVNVTIYYPSGIPSFWNFISGRVNDIVINVDTISIKSIFENGHYSSEYFTNEEQKQRFQQYLNQLWQDKEKELKQLAETFKSL